MLRWVRFADEKLQNAYEAWRVARAEESRVFAEVKKLEAEIKTLESRIKKLTEVHSNGFPSSPLFTEFANRLIDLVDAVPPNPDDLYPGETLGTFVNGTCRHCGRSLLPESRTICDGCPCNGPRGINHGLVAKNTCTCAECDREQTGGTRIGR